jgi:sulfatase maturation enzyme AslB (radical SAM superfamily)
MTFSLDSHKKEIHDKLRRKGSYKRTIEAIKYFSKKIDVKVSICLNKENYKNVKDYILFLDNFGIKDIRFLSVIPTPKNKNFVLTDKQREACCKIINKLRDKINIKLRIISSLSTAKGVDFCSALNLSGLTINPKGELVFCCDIGERGAVIGSLKHNKLKGLIKKGEKISNNLKNKRKNYLDENKTFQGFNTCAFCNRCLKRKIIR